MRFIEKTDEHRLVTGSVAVANEAYEDVFPLAIRSLVEQLVRTFMEEFGCEPHSSWVSKTETSEPALNLTRIEMRITFPTKGDEFLLEGKRIKSPTVLDEHSRLPVKHQADFLAHSDHPDHPLPIRTARLIGWDADTGLMVFGRRD